MSKPNAFDVRVIVEPDSGLIGEPGWWVWEVSRLDRSRPHGRQVLMERSSRWRWLAVVKALWFAWLSRNNRYGDEA